MLILIFIEITACRLKAFGLPDFTGGKLTLNVSSLGKENYF